MDNEPVPAPSNRTYGDITFGYGTGYPLRDGIAIKKYNGDGCAPGAPVGCVGGAWLDWIPAPDTNADLPRWEFNEGSGYVAHLAAQTPCE